MISDIQPKTRGVETSPRFYLLTVAFAVMTGTAVFCSVFAYSYFAQGLDHVTAIPSPEGGAWYQDLGGLKVTEIQDQDLFFHNIGSSIEHVKRADIIILGSSLASFGFNNATLEAMIEKRYGLKVYNMAFVGVAGGEFAKQIIKKHQLKPKLWIINADDGGGGGNFFSRSMVRAFSADVKVIPASESSRPKAYFNVLRRNIRWRIESLRKTPFFSYFFPSSGSPLIPMFYRNAATGEADMRAFPNYLAENNEEVKPTRADCHTSEEVIEIAREYVSAIGGKVVLTVIPNIHACSQQAREIAQALGIEVAIPSKTAYSSWDKGGHLDKKGSIQMTEDIALALTETQTFKDLVKAR